VSLVRQSKRDLYQRPSVIFIEMPAMTAQLAGMPEGRR
jgi:hypothetical protein